MTYRPASDHICSASEAHTRRASTSITRRTMMFERRPNGLAIPLETTSPRYLWRGDHARQAARENVTWAARNRALVFLFHHRNLHRRMRRLVAAAKERCGPTVARRSARPVDLMSVRFSAGMSAVLQGRCRNLLPNGTSRFSTDGSALSTNVLLTIRWFHSSSPAVTSVRMSKSRYWND